jgi:hypothetical protein
MRRRCAAQATGMSLLATLNASVRREGRVAWGSGET